MSTDDELMLLERVFLRFGSAETDEQLEQVLNKFLAPVLLKLSSPEERVRKKVMELLIHINKRLKTRPQVQLPMDVLLKQYENPEVSSFVTNFTIIYIKTGFPRLSIEKQTELVPFVLNSLSNKPQSHVDSLLLLIVPLLGKVKVPTDPEMVKNLFGLKEKPQLSKNLLDILLDILILPYGSIISDKTQIPTPAGMSEHSFKRLVTNQPIKPDQLEEIKYGIVKFLSYDIFPPETNFIHFVVGAADTRFGVANYADNELKKIINILDWNNMKLTTLLYNIFMGTMKVEQFKPELRKLPACTRIRLKILTYLCRCTNPNITNCISVVFDSLYGQNTNSRLKTLALNFTTNVINYSTPTSLEMIAPILMEGLKTQIKSGEELQQGQAYILIGLLAMKIPKIVYHKIDMLELFYSNIEQQTNNQELRLQIREGLLNLILAYKYENLASEEVNLNNRLDMIYLLLKCKMESNDDMVRFIAVRSLFTIFPMEHVPSKYLLLTATGDGKDDVAGEAIKCLYGTNRKQDINLSKNTALIMPTFEAISKYIYTEAHLIVNENKKCFTIGNHVLPFNVRAYVEILLYLRLCLFRGLQIPLERDILMHPNEHTPIVRNFLIDFYAKYDENIETNPLLQYYDLIKRFLLTNQAIEPINCMIELIGCLESLRTNMLQHLQWLKEQLISTKDLIREHISTLYALVINNQQVINEQFKSEIEYLLKQFSNTQLEHQHGAILAVGKCYELKLMSERSNVGQELLKNALQDLIVLLKHSNAMLVGAACESIGFIAHCKRLPLEDGEKLENGSPNPKRAPNSTLTKCYLVNLLLDIMKNTKLATKVREKAIKTLGLLCLGEQFPHVHDILEGLLSTAKETKDVEVHFTIGESLVMCVQGTSSPLAKNPWITPVNQQCNAFEIVHLEFLLDELLKYAKEPHPNVRQASSIWLLALIKACGNCEPVTKRMQTLQDTFMSLLCENNDIVQDVASKSLCVIYDNYKSEQLLSALVKQLTSGTRSVAQVTSDTKLFEEGQLGAAPTGGNLTTYKELCSLASDLNKPDLIYQFMHLANHNQIWNSKKGAAFGFQSIMEQCGDELKQYLPEIIPKFYRYQYDPTPSIQNSMRNIWSILVQEPQKVLDEYYMPILNDLLENINSNQYRVRQSCCLALQDFLKGTMNRTIHDAADRVEEIWTKLFRVMDDHHEQTRLTATKTTKILSRVCIRACDVSQGKLGVKMVETILPPLLNQGITNAVLEIRLISLETISELIKSAGKQLKEFLPIVIPALLQATGEMESMKLSYLSTMLGGQNQAQEVVDNVRANYAKQHFTTETVTKCLQYIDTTILNEIIAKLIDLMKSTTSLGTKIACTHFIILLCVHFTKDDMQLYCGKLLAVLINGLIDRNSAIRKQYATTIGYLVSSAKESSLDRLFAKLKLWYFEREDDSIRSACAYTVQSIGIHNQDVFKNYSATLLPLVFFAMHAEKSEETEKTIEIWQEIWSEHSPGTETGIRHNLKEICEMLKEALEMASWNIKAQAANAISTVASKLGPSIDRHERNTLINILLNGLAGRTWNGKSKLLKALASICVNCKDGIKGDAEVNVPLLVESVLKESRKEEVLYKNDALECLGDIVSALEIDKFDEVYKIVQNIIFNQKQKQQDEDEEGENKTRERENLIKLKQTAYELLGKTWPSNSKETQERYRELFVEHCLNYLPNITRTIQVCVVNALYNFIDKLIILNTKDLNEVEVQSLARILHSIFQAVQYSMSISKHTRLRKETLNIIYCLANKLKENERQEEFQQLTDLFNRILPDIVNDHQPEVKSRVNDIKKILC